MYYRVSRIQNSILLFIAALITSCTGHKKTTYQAVTVNEKKNSCHLSPVDSLAWLRLTEVKTLLFWTSGNEQRTHNKCLGKLISVPKSHRMPEVNLWIALFLERRGEQEKAIPYYRREIELAKAVSFSEEIDYCNHYQYLFVTSACSAYLQLNEQDSIAIFEEKLRCCALSNPEISSQLTIVFKNKEKEEDLSRYFEPANPVFRK